MSKNHHAYALERFDELISSPKNRSKTVRPVVDQQVDKLNKENRESYLNDLINFSGVNISPTALVCISVILGVSCGGVLSHFLPGWLSFVVGCAVAFYPIALLDRRAQIRAMEFALDFPSVLLATASSLTAGHTPLIAIERSTRLLPKDNPVRIEISRLLDVLRTGSLKEVAIREFASDIRLPELELFRSAFLLSLDSGGRFSPTLERLSQVLKDRAILISSARTATAVMRMTSTVLLLLTPLIVGMVAVRTPNFFLLLINHPVARQIGSLGALLIAINCWILRKMSDFRP